MARFVAIVAMLMAALMVVGLVLAHFGVVVGLVVAVVLVGRYLHRHGA
jgi:hypothetical protein